MNHQFDHSYTDYGRSAPASHISFNAAQQFNHDPIANVSDSTDAIFRFMPNAAAPIEMSSCPPDGPSFSVEFDNDFVNASSVLAAGPSTTTTEQAQNSALSFPELPASLLDEAPEYEFSAHTRLNVFEAPDQFGEGIVTFGVDPNDEPLLGAGSEYGLWSATTDDEAGMASSQYMYPQYGHADHLDSLPRSAEHQGTQYTPDALSTARFDHSFDSSSDSINLRGPPPAYGAPGSAQSERGVHEGSSHGAGEMNAPSVLYPGPAASHPDDMYSSQAGPSRLLKRSRESLSNQNSPYTRPAPYQRPAMMGAASTSALPSYTSAGDHETPEARRHSGGEKGSGKEPVVPSQAPGKGRLMSWQSGRPGEGEWQGNAAEIMSGGGMPLSSEGSMSRRSEVHMMNEHGIMSSGVGAGPGPRHLHHSHGPSSHMMHPVHRGLPYGGPMHSVGGHYSNPADMINALGDAMDASIDAEGIARCPYPNCNKTFAKNRSYNLKAHLRSHSQLKPFACSVCPRAFSRKHDLERHARVHSGDKPYVCEICGKGFPRSDALRRHWRVEKECGEKAALLEAGQSVMSGHDDHRHYGGWEERSRHDM